jgi:hypothetical protein
MHQKVIAMRKSFKANVRFILMNSFSTSKDTMDYLAKYPDIASDPDLEFVQNKVVVYATCHLRIMYCICCFQVVVTFVFIVL